MFIDLEKAHPAVSKNDFFATLEILTQTVHLFGGKIASDCLLAWGNLPRNSSRRRFMAAEAPNLPLVLLLIHILAYEERL